MKILFWGTYDTGKPRTRILLQGLRENGVEIDQCHYPLWDGIEDKSQISRVSSKLSFLLRWLLCYPKLILMFCRMSRPDAILVGYLGHLDVIVIWIFAKLKRTPIVWDAFLSLYDTVVCDRKLIHKCHPLAALLYLWEWLACRAADIVILDTREHARHFVELYSLRAEKTGVVFVGAEPAFFPGAKRPACGGRKSRDLSVLFYGQFIPLHGIECIVEAAALLRAEPVSWILIGRGQEERKIKKLIDRHHLEKIEWVPWVAYDELHRWIHCADVCLGIFGQSGKAGRVIPNKVFQILSCGKPLISRDSTAMRELIEKPVDGVYLVKAGSPESLAEAIRSIVQSVDVEIGAADLERIKSMITPYAVGGQLMKHLGRLTR